MSWTAGPDTRSGAWATTRFAVFAQSTTGMPIKVARGIQSQSDARIMAAAPALLAACRAALVEAEHEDNCQCDNTHEAAGTVCRWCWVAETLRAAIRPAEGEVQR